MVTELDRQRMADVQRAVDGRNDMVWMSMQYRCRTCLRIERIYCGVGVEGPEDLRNRQTYIPSPFIGPRCHWCNGETIHVNWQRDQVFPPVDATTFGRIRYFKVPNQWTPEHERYYNSSTFCGEITWSI